MSFAVYAIVSMGRSGSTLLRNELLKPLWVSCLDAAGCATWIERNQRPLIEDDADTFGARYPEFVQQWKDLKLWQFDIKWNFARRDEDRLSALALSRRLIVKDALWVLGRRDPEVFRNLRLIHLLRDPRAIAASYCRPVGRESAPRIFGGGGATGLDVRVAGMRQFAANFGLRGNLPNTEALASSPRHKAASAIVRAHFETLTGFLTRPGVGETDIVVRLEDLCDDRGATLGRLFQFMGVDVEDMPQNSAFFVDADEEGGIRMAEDTAGSRSDAWRKVFSSDELEDVCADLDGVGKAWGY